MSEEIKNIKIQVFDINRNIEILTNQRNGLIQKLNELEAEEYAKQQKEPKDTE